MAEAPDRATIAAAIMPELLGVQIEDDDAVALARLMCDRAGIGAGLPVVREIAGRVGVRTRPLIAEGDPVWPGLVVADLGGPSAAIRAVAPLALTWLHRLSAIASGATTADPGNALDSYASQLSPAVAVDDDGPAFHLEFEG